MRNERRYGFSLMEVLLAIGVLAIGMLFVAGTFPVGIFLTSSATEQTIAPIVADEAFAKIRIYSLSESNSVTQLKIHGGIKLAELRFGKATETKPFQRNFVIDFNDIVNKGETNERKFSLSEQLYPSIPPHQESYYQWSALMRRVQDTPDANYAGKIPVQITVFVSHKANGALKYPNPDGTTNDLSWPEPFNLAVSYAVAKKREITIDDTTIQNYINADSTIMEDSTGNIYRVLDRNDNVIMLDRDWMGDNSSTIWVIPPAVGGSKSPCVGVFQRIIKF